VPFCSHIASAFFICDGVTTYCFAIKTSFQKMAGEHFSPCH
jgi:hypothetical protein